MLEAGPPQIFDLREQSGERADRVRTLRRLMGFLTALVVVIALWFVALGLTQGVSGFQWVVLTVVLVGLTFLAGEFLIVIWKTSPGPIALAIDSEGLEFRWPSGTTDRLPWTGTFRGFDLRDESGVEFMRRYSRTLWELRRWNRPITCLSKEAFDAVLVSASRHGIEVHEYVLSAGMFRWTDARAFRFSPPGRRQSG